nr:hypothetical protein [Tanacetum cinerariifolium]
SVRNLSHVTKNTVCSLAIPLADLLVMRRDVTPTFCLDESHVLIDALRAAFHAKETRLSGVQKAGEVVCRGKLNEVVTLGACADGWEVEPDS